MLSKRLKQLRNEKGLLQKEIAEKLKITTSAYGFYEQGKRMPDIETLKSLAKLFDVTVDYLLGEENTINNTNKPSLTFKDEKEIEKRVAKLREDLTGQEGFMLSGDPASPEAIESILEALEFGIRQAKLINKKYTPKKYRDDE